jgi:RHS repeat-associated protein
VILAEQYRIPASSRVCAGRKLASRIFFESAPKSRLEKLLQVADLHQEKLTRLGQTCTRPSSTAEERDASGNVTKRFFAGGEQIGGINYYFAKDHLGSVREMTDSSGAIRARYEYDPYGRQTKVSGDLEVDFGFTGFYRHQASGLNLTLFRVYDPELGRWTTRDPIAEKGGLNLYAYVGNDPIGNTDVLGLCKCSSKDVPDDPGWHIENDTDIQGKKIVGLLVTDYTDWLEPIDGHPRGVLSHSGTDLWGPAIKAINEQLASKGQAVAIAIVDNKGGYLRFMDHTSETYGDLKTFAAVFHGRGSEGHELVRIGNSAMWSVDDSEDEAGFTSFTKRHITKEARMSNYSTYCSSDNPKKPIVSEMFKSLLK